MHRLPPTHPPCLKHLWPAAAQNSDIAAISSPYFTGHQQAFYHHAHHHSCHTIPGLHHPIPHPYSACNAPSPPVTPSFHHHHHHHHGLSPVSPPTINIPSPTFSVPSPVRLTPPGSVNIHIPERSSGMYPACSKKPLSPLHICRRHEYLFYHNLYHLGSVFWVFGIT